MYSICQEEARKLEFATWLVAWDRYALAALAVEHQLDFSVSLLHKEVVLAIATAAAAGGRSELLGVLYDELARCCFVVAVGVRFSPLSPTFACYC